MKYKNIKFHNALLAYTKVAIGHIQAYIKGGGRLVEYQEEMYGEGPDNSFSKQLRTISIWSLLFNDIETELSKLEEYKTLLDEINSDQVIAKHLDGLIGTAMSQTRVTKSNIIDGIAIEIFSKKQEVVFDENLFEEEYSILESAIYSDSIEYEYAAPLPGFHSALPTMHLGENLCIDKLTSDQTVKCLNYEIIQYNVARQLPEFAIRFKYSLPKVIGDMDIKEKEKVFSERPDASIMSERIIHSLALFKKGECHYSGIMQFSNNWFGRRTFHFSKHRLLEWWKKYSLNEDEAQKFISFWKLLNSNNVKKSKAINLSIKRFGFAKERSRIEDKIIDFMIAAEALYLTGISEKELSYRLSLRAGLFSSDNPDDQIKGYNFMRQMYHLRSNLVHGSDNPKMPKGDDGKPMSEGAALNKLEDFLREALHKAINKVSESSSPYDWDKMWDNIIFSR